MWQLIRFELAYRAVNYAGMMVSCWATYILFSSPLLFDAHFRQQSYPGYLFVIFMMILLTVYLLMKAWSRENRDRHLLILPINLRTVGVVRIMLDVMTWISMLALLLLFSSFSVCFRVTGKIRILLLLTTGFAFTAVSLFSILRDLVLPLRDGAGHSLMDRIIAHLLVVLIPVVLNLHGFLVLFLTVNGLRGQISPLTVFLLNPLVAGTALLIGVAMLMLGVVVFEKRNSYLSS